MLAMWQANYWIWRIEPAFGGSNMVQAERERVCSVCMIVLSRQIMIILFFFTIFFSPSTFYSYKFLQQGCFSPLWIAFCILIGGLLLDVLISISLGVSALPANIIIGMLLKFVANFSSQCGFPLIFLHYLILKNFLSSSWEVRDQR